MDRARRAPIRAAAEGIQTPQPDPQHKGGSAMIPKLCRQTQDEHFDLNQRWGLKLGLALVLALGVGLLTAAPASAV